MNVGIGLPSTISGVAAEQVLGWARRAEERGFSSLGVIDRLVYGNDEPVVTLAAAAAVTERIALVTSIAIVPYRANAALLAKQAATVDHLSGGRLVFGVAPGGREDDYTASGVPFSNRGRRFEEMLEEMGRIWSGEPRGTAGAIGPTPADGRPTVILGGSNDRAFSRAATYGEGWMMGGGTPDMFGQAAAKVRAEWSAQGRDGDPRLMALAYFALGPGARRSADGYLRDYYAFLGPFADTIASNALVDGDAVRGAVAAFEQAGCDELILFPCDPDPAQVDLLADALR